MIIEQTIIPVLEGNSISYNISNGDTYIASQNITNTNRTSYNPEDNTIVLMNLQDVPGYTFMGWFNGAGDNATRITEIPKGSNRNWELYAHWKQIVYNVQYECDLVQISDLIQIDDYKTYTVNKGLALPSLKLDGYIFAGWSDGNGDILKTIPKGTTGDKIFTANWLSERNQAWTKKKLDAPIIIEDEKTNTILFTYEIGEIRNVPLYVIEDFGKINSNGVSKTVTKTFSTTVSESQMENCTNTVVKATTDSLGISVYIGFW